MDKYLSIKLKKIEVAKKQLDCALRLHFNEEEEIISKHTLGAASLQILHDLAEKKGMDTYIFGAQFSHLNVDRGKIIKNLRKPQNFFKHSSKEDIDDTIEFVSEMTDLFLIDGCDIYKRLTGIRDPLHTLYELWFVKKYPDIAMDDIYKGRVDEIIGEISIEDRKRFYSILLPEVERVFHPSIKANTERS
ncbi:MAG: hypothetical protein EOM19_06860 [Candidatus Moranbacteria bacterium]|nr:hypothetical protein [Candidatus Moranbacteria bacterium]